MRFNGKTPAQVIVEIFTVRKVDLVFGIPGLPGCFQVEGKDSNNRRKL